MGIQDEQNGVKLVKPEDDKGNGSQDWVVTRVEIDSDEYLMFSIGDSVLTGKWNINVQEEGNIVYTYIYICWLICALKLISKQKLDNSVVKFYVM